MNRLLTVILMFVFATFAYTQTMNVESFELAEMDLTANTAGTIVYDQNGDKCALIKIETIENGFSFDVGTLGVMKTEQHVGEIWLYVPEGVKRISISHPNYEKIRDYDLGLSVKKSRTYIMKLHVVRASNSNSEMGSINAKSDPEGAEIFLDGISLGKTPLSFSGIIPGKHNLLLKKEGYYDYDTEVTIEKDKESIINEPLSKSCDIIRYPDRIEITTKGITFTMIKVKGGDFMMGATPEQMNRRVDEVPAHRVTLSDYYIGETEVTNELWAAIMGSIPSVTFTSLKMPVNNMTWNDCQRFINRLSSLTGLRFALPTEAQWEFAARGGTQSRGYIYSGSNNLKEVGWYKKNSKQVLHDVRLLRPNELGLYDMSGNVFEWCQDWYVPYNGKDEVDPRGPEHGTTKVNRSSGAGEKDAANRVSARSADNPASRYQVLGLRLAIIE